MDSDRLGPRNLAMWLARTRAIAGMALLVAPGAINRQQFGRTSPELRAMTRMMGVRDMVLGVGALTAIKENTQGPEWLGMGGLSDAVDAVVTFGVPDAPLTGRLIGVVATGACVASFALARALADERTDAS